MRAKIFIALFITLSGCSSISPEKQACLEALESVQFPLKAHDMAVASLIGRPAEETTLVEGYTSIRVLRPNSMMTMDYRLDRINLHTDCDGIILATTNG